MPHTWLSLFRDAAISSEERHPIGLEQSPTRASAVLSGRCPGTRELCGKGKVRRRVSVANWAAPALVLASTVLSFVACGRAAEVTAPEQPAKLTDVDGVTFAGVAGETSVAVRVKATDSHGAARRGAVVTFTITRGNGRISPVTAATDSLGIAATVWTISSTVGTNTLSAFALGLPSVVFTATGKAGPPATLVAIAGDNQLAPVDDTVPIKPAVWAKDASGNSVPGVPVTFVATGGGANVSGTVVTSDNSGIATVGRVTLGLTAGLQTLEARAAGLRVTIRLTGVDRRLPVEIRSMLAGLRLLNYYPSRNAWSYLWDRFPKTEIDSDFTRIAAMGFNAVRIFVHVPNLTSAALGTTRAADLATVIDLADRHGLRVALALFDFMGTYNQVPASRRWLDSLIAPYKNDRRIVFVDAQNEIDSTRPDVMGWLVQIMPDVRRVVGRIPVTASVTMYQGLPLATHMRNLATSGATPDFYDVHFSTGGSEARVVFRDVIAAARSVPVVVGETGFPTTTQPFSLADGASAHQRAREALQDLVYRTVFRAAQVAGLPMPAPWIYADFIPSAIQANLFGSNTATEMTRGILRTDYSEKPVVATLRAYIAGAPIDTTVNNGFELDDGIGRPAIWRVYENVAAGWTAQTYDRDTTVSHTGRAAARIAGATGSPNGSPAFYVAPIEQPLPGERFSVSAWIKGANVTGEGYVALAWFAPNGAYISGTHTPSISAGTTAWTQLTLSDTMPANAGYVQVFLTSRLNPSGTVWFDDVMFGKP